MKTARAFAVLALLAAGLISAEVQNLDLLRLLMERPLLGGHHRWDRHPSIEDRLDQFWHRKYGDDTTRYSGDLSGASSKRSAVATALNAGRPRRQPTPALGKAVTPFSGVGILNDMENFFASLRGNMAVQTSMSPDDQAHFYETPSVVRPPPSGGGGGSGMRKLHALRPLRPTGNIRFNKPPFSHYATPRPGRPLVYPTPRFGRPQASTFRFRKPPQVVIRSNF